MKNATWLGRVAERMRHVCSAPDDAVFREPDLDAVARGWQVRKGRAFSRTYRDPRWDTIVACPDCWGDGTFGAHFCASCDGRGTVRNVPADEQPPRTAGVHRIAR